MFGFQIARPRMARKGAMDSSPDLALSRIDPKLLSVRLNPHHTRHHDNKDGLIVSVVPERVTPGCAAR